MNLIAFALVAIFALISLALFLLFNLNPLAAEQNPLQKRRLVLTGTKLKITEQSLTIPMNRTHPFTGFAMYG